MAASDPTNRYELFEALGEGTSAVVYRSHDRLLGRDVALKLLRATQTAEATRRLEREAKVAAAFRHRHAVEIYEIGELDGRAFLAMELVRGGTLAQHLERAAPAGTRAAIAIGAALAEVLAAAHASGLVHRDVKPSNVFVDGELAAPARVRLVDFGLSFLLEPSSRTLGRLTEEGFVLGTPAYMAPEQADGRPITPAADVYALGCLLYELVGGRTPFVGDLPRMLAAHLYLPPIPLDELDLVEEVPSWLGAEILSALAKDPAQRPSAAELHARLSAPAPVRVRSTGDRPRAERSFTSVPFTAPATPVFGVALAEPAGADAETLRAAGVAVVDPDVADLVLVPLADDGSYPEPFRGKRVVGLHRAPTPSLIASAIRHGAVMVMRTPLADDQLASRLAGLAHSRRLTRG